MNVEKKKFVDKELEGFVKVNDLAQNKNLKQELKSDNFEFFFFQFPKNFDISKLDGQKLNLKQDIQALEGVGNEEKEEIVLEQLGLENSKYVTNQILPMVVNSKKNFAFKKKFAKVFKLYSRYDPGRIRKRFIIKTKPRVSNKILEEAQARGVVEDDDE
mmetsp:Transcript_45561/g.52659  ORF Transcript_45561/g.52659 Transcript_45561/m.52659 type:complete len:159 (+) Transcript_45561:23-499(+)